MEEAAADNSVLDTDSTEVASRLTLISPITVEQAAQWMKKRMIWSEIVGSEFKLYQMALIPSLKAGEKVPTRSTETFEKDLHPK